MKTQKEIEDMAKVIMDEISNAMEKLNDPNTRLLEWDENLKKAFCLKSKLDVILDILEQKS